MIIHSLLQQMQNDGFGTVNDDLQLGVLPLDEQGDPRNGIAVTVRGGPVNRLKIAIQPVDFYVRDTNPFTAIDKAQGILNYLQESFSEICTLPPLSGITEESFTNVTITPVTSVESVGDDDNGGHTFVVSGEIRYNNN